jgi:hypothetical protein
MCRWKFETLRTCAPNKSSSSGLSEATNLTANTIVPLLVEHRFVRVGAPIITGLRLGLGTVHSRPKSPT